MFHQQGTSTITARFGNGHVVQVMGNYKPLKKGHDWPPYSGKHKDGCKTHEPSPFNKQKDLVFLVNKLKVYGFFHQYLFRNLTLPLIEGEYMLHRLPAFHRWPEVGDLKSLPE
jgi:hypothetical protein